MKNTAKVCIAYCGPKVDDGTMDAETLGAVLIAMNGLVNQANRLLNNDGSTVEVRVKSDFHKGSFEIMLALMQSLPEKVRSLFSAGYSVEQIAQFLDLLNNGKEAAVMVGGGLLWALKKVRGKKIEKAEEKDGKVEVHTADDSFLVDRPVYYLLRDEKIRLKLADLLKPLENAGVERFEVRDGHGAGNATMEVDGFEYEHIKGMQSDMVEEQVNTSVVTVTVEAVTFEGASKWKFNDGTAVFPAAMMDAEFLAMVTSGRIRLSPKDLLKVEIEKRQQIQNGGGIKRASNSIIRVIEYTPQD